MLGNVWEWTASPHKPGRRGSIERVTQRQYILKGGSFIDFREDKANINHAARISNRSGAKNPEEFGTSSDSLLTNFARSIFLWLQAAMIPGIATRLHIHRQTVRANYTDNI